MSTDVLHLAIDQFAPRLREPAANLERIAAAAGDADLVLTPELSLTGYDVGDAAHSLAAPLRMDQPLPHGACDTRAACVLGVIERGDDGRPYNTAALLRGGRLRFRHRKLYLPTYGMFDEGRFFARGDEIRPIDIDGWCAGIQIGRAHV